MWSKKDLVVDEIEKLEREETSHLLKTIINLTFVTMLREKVKVEVLKEYRHGRNVRPSLDQEIDLKDLIFYDDEGLAAIDWVELWETVCDICYFMNIPLHKSWRNYLPKVKNLTTSVLHQALLEVQNFPTSSPVTSLVSSIIYHGYFKIHGKMYPYCAHNA